MKITRIIAAVALCSLPLLQAGAQKQAGGLAPETLQKLREGYQETPANKALHNAIAGNSIDKLALNADNRNNLDMNFSHRVPSKGITNQKSSGRCWLFTGLNMLRAQAMNEHNLPQLEFSQVYNFFYDQLEKSNLFLQGIIDTAKKPADDQTVKWLFEHPLNDGGQFTGVADIITKYGVVPKEIMADTFTIESTSKIRQLLT
ncbi:MAG: aminopeptidase, partial [Muribaculaceae bacterium]|nr:aminopeptidase [Muribaculaceae bacterium]